MNSKERAALRAAANPLEPIFQVGKEGVCQNLISQLDDALDARELLKVRVHLETSPEKPRQIADKLQAALGAEVIQVIGKADEEKIRAKKAASQKSKKPAKKRVKIKGLRARNADKAGASRQERGRSRGVGR